MKKIALLIPAYNEEKHIDKVIKNSATYHMDMIIVDDGSIDKTTQIIEKIKALGRYQLIFLKHEKNQGKGAALQTGFKYVLEKDYQGVITIDADAQHKTEEINDFLELIKKENPDLIIGSRLQNHQGMPFIRLGTNVFTSWLISLLAGKRVDDVQSGFRYLSARLLKNVELRTKSFDTEPEIILKAAWLGFKIKNIPISTIYHPDAVSQVNPFLDTVKFFNLVSKSLVWRRRIKKQKLFNLFQ
jgi:glycosyltransferase involved in cell wall biosynthesis